MSNAKLFTAIYIPETPFVNGILKPKKGNKYNFELLESEKIADTLYHFIYKKDEIQYYLFFEYWINVGADVSIVVKSP